MTETTKDRFKNYHLIVSTIILLPIAIAYGLSPNTPGIFEFNIEGIELKSILRGTMALYMGMIAIWILGLAKNKWWATATITNVVFFATLGIGRLLSIVLDGIPTTNFLIGIGVELLLALWGIINLKRTGFLGTKFK